VVATATLLMAIKGYAAPETERAFARARSLCDASRPSRALYRVLRGLVSYHHVRAELRDAFQLGDELLRHAASRPDDRALRIQAHYGHGATLFHMGALEGAREHFEKALRDYDTSMHREHIVDYGGYDPGVACSMWLAWTLAFTGRLEEAAARNREGLEIARRVDDPFSLAWAHHAAGLTHGIFGDWGDAESASAESVRIAEEHGFPHVLGMAKINRGWSLLMRGNPGVAIPMIYEGVAEVDATGAQLVRPAYLGMLAAADAVGGDGGAAARRIDESLAEIERTGERLHEPALLVAKSMLLARGVPDQEPPRRSAEAAEARLRRALELAREQGARLFELRAAVALAQHCRTHGDAADGRAALESAHAPFAASRVTTPDIVAARQLLDELGARSRRGRRRTPSRLRDSRRA
jgi:tetratricopeptide (TPR) repeat protein